MTDKKFIITKRIAKHGKQAVIIVPALLQEQLKPGTLAQLTIQILREENGAM
jgi:predicted RNA binding protein YcfA (HicA-like mRNA interferase family)